MDETEGTHGPVGEEVIASLFEKHHGSGVYELRTSKLPDYYTRGFQYFYLIHEGKILSVIGYSDWGDYVVLGGGKTHNSWKKKSNYFGSPIEKVIMARQPYIRGKPAIAGFSNFPGWQERMVKAGWKMKPLDNYGIDPEMVDNFRDDYGSHPEKTWGIRISDYDIENMVKAYEDFDNSWWNLLKNLDRYGEPRMKTESSQTSRTANEGIKTKLGTTPLTMGDEEEDCCENALQQYKEMHDELYNYWVDIGKEKQEFEYMYSFGPARMILNTDITPNIMLPVSTNELDWDKECQDFHDFLTILWGRIHTFIALLPTSSEDLFKRGSEIKRKINGILTEWEDCDGTFGMVEKTPSATKKGQDLWKSVLKDTRQISQTGIRTKLGTTPLTMGDDDDCCQEAKTAYKRAYIMAIDYKSTSTGFGGYYGITEESDPLDDYDSLVREEIFTTFVDDSSCDEFKEQIKYISRYPDIKPYIDKILSDWEECENE